MDRETILINKDLIPYEFNIVIGGELFTFVVDYNYVGEFFTIGLIKDGKTLCSGSPIMYGRPLFEEVWKPDFPAVDIVPYDPSKSYNRVTYINLCEGVLLVLDNGETSVLEE